MRKNGYSNRRKLINSYDKNTFMRIQFICVQTKIMIRTKQNYPLPYSTSVINLLTAENFFEL